MPRTLRGGIDQLGGYRHLASFPDPLPPPEDDYFEFATSLHFAQSNPISTITIWGTGLITFGPATEAQRAFMANVGTSTDLSAFPGDYVALGFSAAQYEPIEVIIFSYPQVDFWVQTGGGRLVINEEGLIVTDNGGNAHQTGWSIGSLPAHSGAGTFYWSDLDVISGTSGSDTVNGTGFAETLRGLDGDDTLIAGAGADALDGGNGDDSLFGGEGMDRMWGGGGDDLLHAGNDFRHVDGGAGFDRLALDYSGSANSLVLHGSELLARPNVIGIEALVVTGTDHVDVISGSANNDRLFGGGSFDLLIGGDGDDLLDAGAAGPSAVGVTPDGGMTIADALPIDHLFTAGAGGGTLTTSLVYTPFLLDPESGTEVYAFTVSEAGAQMWIDWTFAPAPGGISNATFTLTVTGANGVEVDRGTYDPAVPYVFPTAGTYYLTASLFSGSTWEYGDLQLDLTLEGAAVLSSNRLVGGDGDDTYLVHSANDQVVEESNGGSDSVLSGVSYALSDHVEQLVLTGNAAIDGTGSAGANLLIGNAAGNRLTGGDGADRLFGGAGADTFVFTADELGTTRTGEHDLILDFRARQDKIDLSALYDGVAFGGLRSGRASDAASLDDYQALTFSDRGRAWLVGDTDGIAGADFAIEIAGGGRLRPADVIVVPSADLEFVDGVRLDLRNDVLLPDVEFWELARQEIVRDPPLPHEIF